MTAIRPVLSLVTVLSLFGSACSSDDPAPPATGGTSGTAGRPGQGGTTATGGSSGSAGANSKGGTSGQGGTTSTGGSAQSGTGGVTSSGGSAQSGSGGGTNTGGSTSAGSGGAAAGGASGSGTGGSAAGASGSGGTGGVAGMGGSGAGGSSAGSGGGGAEQSAGCGTSRTLQNGTINIMFNNASRNYILRVPAEYDNNHPYRLVFAFAESGSSAMSVATRNYFTLATLDSTNTIFVAPDAANGAGSWSQSDVDLTDLILGQLEEDLCIDKRRIFATGFSFGGAMSLALACTRADVFRGVAFFSGADLTGSCTGTLTKPIAYYASQASGDSSGDPIPSSGRIKQAQFAELNGCTAEPTATTFPAPGQPHKCTVYQGCSAGHPTVYCVFDGPHGWEPRDPGQSMSWNAPKAWEFITQF
jgi:poly(3-hydroxybutyrate) depolymerase